MIATVHCNHAFRLPIHFLEFMIQDVWPYLTTIFLALDPLSQTLYLRNDVSNLRRKDLLERLYFCLVSSSNSRVVKLQFKAGCWVKSQFKLLCLASDNKALEWKCVFRIRHLSFVCWIWSTGRLFGWVCLATRHHYFHLTTVFFPHMGKKVQEYQDWCCMSYFILFFSE